MATQTQKAGAELLIEVGQRLFLERGYANVSMQQIAEEAGMTKGAPYYHFKSKEELFIAVSRDVLVGMRATVNTIFSGELPFPERLRQGLMEVLSSTTNDLSIWFSDLKQVMQPERVHDLFGDVANLGAFLLPSFEYAAARGEFTRVAPDVAARIFMQMMISCVGECNYMRDIGTLTETDIERFANEVVDILLHGIMGPADEAISSPN